MGLYRRTVSLLVLPVVWGCATSTLKGPEPLPIEFGQDRYLSDAYLTVTSGARCGHPAFAPRGFDVGAPLPDGTWFRVVAVGPPAGQFDTIVLERGVKPGVAVLTMRLDETEGIVRLEDAGRKDAWGIHHPWADWLRALGGRVATLRCAQAQ